MRNQPENTVEAHASQAPMKRVFILVLFSITAVMTVSLLWHSMGMAKQRVAEEAEEQRISTRIARLTRYRDDLRVATSTTSASSTQVTPTPLK